MQLSVLDGVNFGRVEYGNFSWAHSSIAKIVVYGLFDISVRCRVDFLSGSGNSIVAYFGRLRCFQMVPIDGFDDTDGQEKIIRFGDLVYSIAGNKHSNICPL